MADDLDDFFDEIDEAVAEVTENETAIDPQTKADGNNDATATAAAAVAVAANEQPTPSSANIKDEQIATDRPAKRIKVATAPARPKGAVVAASAASSSVKKSQPIAPPPPPPKPSSSSTTTQLHTNTNDRYSIPTHATQNPQLHGQQQQQPPLPPGPPPKTNKPVVRMAAGKSWVDKTLADWPENDFRIFVGNLGPEVDDAMLLQFFSTKYASATMSKIVRDASQKTKGYGFVSFLQPLDCAKAIREQDQAWLGSRPIRVKRSDWQERNKSTVQKKNRNDRKQQKKRGGGRLY